MKAISFSQVILKYIKSSDWMIAASLLKLDIAKKHKYQSQILMKEILDETVAEAAYEKKVALFKKALLFASSAGVIIIILLSLYSIREEKITSLNSEISNLLFKSINNPDNKEYVAKLIDKINGQDTAATNVAKLYLFGLDVKNKNFPSAVTILHEIISSPKASDIIKNYAKINMISISLDHPDLVPNIYIERYAQEIEVSSSPLVHNGKIIKSLYLIKNGKPKEAKALAESVLSDSNASQEIQIQAQAIIANMEYEKKTLKP
jgi:hypothetical protein